ncbi:hypothetical protein [Clostridium tetani]|uniref:hypothetical protein n=1 Tax=Clostridium tetani TaxID=1513 RepID=UPI0005144631|nr:hypothetical protein [Clostridium tetani]KGI41533.1 hypothetical protein KY55_13850 [Clostridium tetani]RXI67871.1 hypothetical protein DP127_13800 [Clostridium tetani]BDR77056.1 hypothetical protein K154306013_p11070 [Clostridium tetani]BDR88188.1 hypothetical protein N071400001_p11230 [Clostridium tetani]
MSKGYEIVTLGIGENLEIFDACPEFNNDCPKNLCPGQGSDILCNVPIGICSCPPPPPDSGCPLAICGPEMAKNPGNR